MKSDYNLNIFKQLDKMESTLENTKAEHKIEMDYSQENGHNFV